MATQTVKIDEDGRYVMVFEAAPGGETINSSTLEDIGKNLKDWWNSKQKFYLLAISDDIKVRLERVNEPHP